MSDSCKRLQIGTNVPYCEVFHKLPRKLLWSYNCRQGSCCKRFQEIFHNRKRLHLWIFSHSFNIFIVKFFINVSGTGYFREFFHNESAFCKRLHECPTHMKRFHCEFFHQKKRSFFFREFFHNERMWNIVNIFTSKTAFIVIYFTNENIYIVIYFTTVKM